MIRRFLKFIGMAAIIGALPNTLTNGTVADATQVMANFNTIVNAVNSNAAALATTPQLNLANTFTQPQTGVSATALSNFPIVSDIQNGAYVTCGTIGGSANAITGVTIGVAPAANAANQRILFIPVSTNTGATTFARDGLPALNVFYNGKACVGGEIVANVPVMIFDDGTQYNIIGNGLAPGNAQQQQTVASAATTNLDTSSALYQQITGVTGITAFTLANGHIRIVEFAGILTMTNGASLILPGAANITTAAGDTAIICGEAAGVVRVVAFNPASGRAVVGTTAAVRTDQQTGTSTTVFVNPAVQQFHDSAAKATAFFDGTAGGPITPASSYNVTNVTKNGTGDYTINLTNAMASGNYTVIAQASDSGAPQAVNICHVAAHAAGGPRIKTYNSGNVATDYDTMMVVVYGRLA